MKNRWNIDLSPVPKMKLNMFGVVKSNMMQISWLARFSLCFFVPLALYNRKANGIFSAK